MKAKHLHSWRRAIHPKRYRAPKVYDNFFFICDKPDCSLKKRFEDIMKKYAECSKCGNKFIVSEEQWNEYKLICETCKILEGLPQDILDNIKISVQLESDDNSQGSQNL